MGTDEGAARPDAVDMLEDGWKRAKKWMLANSAYVAKCMEENDLDCLLAEYATEYASSSNAALQQELEYVQGRRDQAETWMSELGAQIREERVTAEAKVAALEAEAKVGRAAAKLLLASDEARAKAEAGIRALRDSRDRLQATVERQEKELRNDWPDDDMPPQIP